MASERVPAVKINKARIIWRSFGTPDKYGKKGFNVIIEDGELAEQLRADGWNVHELQPREEGDPVVWRIPVETRWDKKPPLIRQFNTSYDEHHKIVDAGGKDLDFSVLDEEGAACLDYADIEAIDMILSPSVWDDRGVQAVKAYLGKMNIWLSDEEF